MPQEETNHSTAEGFTKSSESIPAENPSRLLDHSVTYSCSYCGPRFTTNIYILSAIKCAIHGEVLTISEE